MRLTGSRTSRPHRHGALKSCAALLCLGLTLLTAGCGGGSQRINADFSFTPQNPTVNQPVTFTAVNICTTCQNPEYAWDFDNDGNYDATGISVQRTFSLAGTFDIHLLVTIGSDIFFKSRTITVTTLADDSASLTVYLANPADAGGTILVSSISADAIDPTRSEITVSGLLRTASGPDAAVKVQFDTDTGANPAVDYTWGTNPANEMYCFNCSGMSVIVVPAQHRVRVTLTNVILATGADPEIHGQLRGSIDATLITASDCGAYPAAGDAYVSSGDPTSSLGGISTALQVSSISDSSADKAYLAFDLGTIPAQFTSVKLALRTLPGVAPGATTRLVNFFGITDNNDWDPDILTENQINWNNAPHNDTASGTSFLDFGQNNAPVQLLDGINIGLTDGDARIRIDISDYVRWAKGLTSTLYGRDTQDNDGRITIMLAHDAQEPFENTDLFRSKEASVDACDAPHLEVQP